VFCIQGNRLIPLGSEILDVHCEKPILRPNFVFWCSALGTLIFTVLKCSWTAPTVESNSSLHMRFQNAEIFCDPRMCVRNDDARVILCEKVSFSPCWFILR
jgi:hypothetical protein